MKIEGKAIVLTGAASGIGLALLGRLADNTCNILAVDINQPALQDACAAVSGKRATVTPFVIDLSCRENVDALFEQALQSLGRIDLFFANAGFAYYEEVDRPDWEHIEKIFRLNVFNTLYTIEKMQAVCQEMPGKVVVTASAMAFLAVPGYAIYSATKAALHRFVDAYRWQMQDSRRLLLVYPIATRTGFFQAAGRDVPAAWPSQSPDKVARAILRGVRSDRQAVYPSFLFSLVLFLDRFLPMHWLEQFIEQQRLKKWIKRTGGS